MLFLVDATIEGSCWIAVKQYLALSQSELPAWASCTIAVSQTVVRYRYRSDE